MVLTILCQISVIKAAFWFASSGPELQRHHPSSPDLLSETDRLLFHSTCPAVGFAQDLGFPAEGRRSTWHTDADERTWLKDRGKLQRGSIAHPLWAPTSAALSDFKFKFDWTLIDSLNWGPRWDVNLSSYGYGESFLWHVGYFSRTLMWTVAAVWLQCDNVSE